MRHQWLFAPARPAVAPYQVVGLIEVQVQDDDSAGNTRPLTSPNPIR
jgi:hypothetical protein